MATQIYVAFGVGIVAFLLMFFAFKLDDQHWFLQIIMIGITLHLTLLIPATFVNFNESCYPVVNTSEVSGSTTTYTYGEFCNTKDTTTPNSFFKMYLWVIRVFWIYVIIVGIKKFFYDTLWRKGNGQK